MIRSMKFETTVFNNRYWHFYFLPTIHIGRDGTYWDIDFYFLIFCMEMCFDKRNCNKKRN